jgi:internalin A
VYRNQLDSLPDMTNLKNLKRYFIAGNEVRQMPDFTGCSSLLHIVASNNNLSVLPDFTQNTQLNRVLFSWNKFKTVDFSKMPSVTEAHFVSNSITKFPDISGRTNLTELRLAENNIDSMPDLSAFTNLVDFDIAKNRYTFEDLAKFNPTQTMTFFNYDPQQLVGKSDTVIKRQNDRFTLEWPVKNPLATNQYTWFKDGKAIATSSSPSYTIPKIDKSNQGSYYIECRNAAYPKLVLKSKNVLLRVVDCFDLTQMKLTYEASSCKFPIAATVDESTIAFGRKPFSYKLRNTLSNEETKFKSPNLSIAKEGTYDFVLTDSAGCEQVLKNFIQTSRPDNCDAIFYPGLNGAESTFYIDQKGTARIYNNAGHKLKELSVPAYWDGRDNNGQLLDSGMYLIIVNEQVKIPISLMRVN